MKVIDIFPWKVNHDKNATRNAYENIGYGYAEICGCEHCQNYISVCKKVFPEKVIKVFHELGIDFQKEGEVFYLNKTERGLHNYGGWFHFVGNVECVGDTELNEDERLTNYIAVDENFSWSFSNDSGTPHNNVFDGFKLGLIYFSVNIPWIIKTEEPQ